MTIGSRRFVRELLERQSKPQTTTDQSLDVANVPWAHPSWEQAPLNDTAEATAPTNAAAVPAISHDISRIGVNGDAPLHRPTASPAMPHLTVQRFAWHDSAAPLPVPSRSGDATSGAHGGMERGAPAHSGVRPDASGHKPIDPSGGQRPHELSGGHTHSMGSGTMGSDSLTDASGDAVPDKSIAASDDFQDQSEEASQRSFGKKREGLEVYVEAEGADESHDFPDGYKWTQVINTNKPKGGSTSPYTDPRPDDDEKPFYWNDAEQETYPTAFHDVPQRPAPAQGAADWDATLTLNGVDEASKTAVPIDTVTYGFSQDSDRRLTLRAPEPSAPDVDTLEDDFSDWKFQ